MPVREIVAIRAPSEAWKPVEPRRTDGWVSFYFGGGTVQDRGYLRSIATWQSGEHGFITVYRRVDPNGRAAVDVEPPLRDAPKSKRLPGGARWYELGSDGTQYYWVTSGSLVIEGRDTGSLYRELAAVLRPWTPDALKALATPRIAPPDF